MTAPAQDPVAAALRVVRAGTESGLAYLRKQDPQAADEIDTDRRRGTGPPVFVVVGETKRGKSSLVNALVGVPGLSPVDASVATSASTTRNVASSRSRRVSSSNMVRSSFRLGRAASAARRERGAARPLPRRAGRASARRR